MKDIEPKILILLSKILAAVIDKHQCPSRLFSCALSYKLQWTKCALSVHVHLSFIFFTYSEGKHRA